MRGIVSVLLALVAVTATAEIRVEVVLDASQAMWTHLDDGRPAFVAARMALRAWVLERTADRDVMLGLRLAGGGLTATADSGCEDLELAITPAAVDVGGWRMALEGIRPAGLRPLLQAVAAAGGDLGDGPDPRRIVLITSGEETCFGDPRAAIDVLGSGVQLRIIGLGLPEPVVERLGAIAPTRNATSTAALIATLRWAVEELPSAAPADAPVRVRTDGLREYSAASLVDAITAERHDLSTAPGELAGAAPPGCYALELTSAGGDSTTRVEGVELMAGTGLDLTLEYLPPPLPDFEVIPERAWLGGPVFVQFGAVGPGSFRVSLAGADEPAGAWLAAADAVGPEGLVELRAPDEPASLEVRLDEQLGAGLSRLVIRAPIEVIGPDAAVEAADEVRPFDPLPVKWSGPNDDGDSIVVVPTGGPQHPSASCRLTAWGNPAELTAPGEEGSWEVRYVSGLSGRTFASAAVTVTAIIVTLTAPAEVGVGRTFEVSWDGPADQADFLALATAGEPDGDYLTLFLASNGNPARFVAPRDPGSYEIRYVDGDDGRVLRRASVTVVETPVQLKAPRKVRAGTRFDVRWSGPDLPGDFLAVARPGDPPGRYEDWAYTTLGSPTNLAAPFEAGSYEIRYVSESGQKIVAAIDIRVEGPR
jgi:Ca-activated chloride channel family protein